ncbi:hypothetical protein WR25_02725 [Diploscapter pachys]|uniref:Uncharacterized protein n=1 Tax=Diploscapter pachys TaxID=2018661 RepID=A0A2A2JQG9_9BILA|nr:hypothetical protein WR25_02725 [Diploscapter pachys]
MWQNAAAPGACGFFEPLELDAELGPPVEGPVAAPEALELDDCWALGDESFVQLFSLERYFRAVRQVVGKRMGNDRKGRRMNEAGMTKEWNGHYHKNKQVESTNQGISELRGGIDLKCRKIAA